MKTIIKSFSAVVFIFMILYTNSGCITNKNSISMKQIINSPVAPSPIGPYSQAVLAGNTLFASGQIAINPQTGNLVMDDIKKETVQVMENLKAVLKAADMTFANVVKASIFITDMNNFAQINEVYGSYFTDNFPARETVQVTRLPKDVHVEISVIAVK